MSVLALTCDLSARPSITTDDAGCQALSAPRIRGGEVLLVRSDRMKTARQSLRA